MLPLAVVISPMHAITKALSFADGGSLFVCGLNKDGQLGLGHTEDVLYFTPCRSLLGCPIQQVACGWDFTIILTGELTPK